MKSIGQQAKEFREAKGWSYVRMAEEVSKHNGEPVSRQLITQLEEAGDRKPRYLLALAQTMGLSTDDLLFGRYNPPDAAPAALQGAEEPQAAYAPVSPARAIAVIAQALLAMGPPARERAATLLSSMARDPEGRWSEWLTDLVEGEVVQREAQSVKTDRAGNHPSISSNQTSTMNKSEGAAPGASLTKALKGGDDFAQSPGLPESRTGNDN